MQITLGNTIVELLAGRAAFLPHSRSLVAADLHLGKSATFRSRGIAVPEGTTVSDLARLSALIESTKAEQLVIAGDLVHSADGLTQPVLDTFANWLKDIGVPVTLTEGNHDTRFWLPELKLPFEIVPELLLEGITITHDPADLLLDSPGIAGHIHPGARISEAGRNPVRVPGFFLGSEQHLILPAFSEFTGIQPMKFAENDRFYTEIRGSVSEIPAELLGKRRRS